MADVAVPSGGLDLDAVGRRSGPVERTWSSRDALLYAVGVGAGQEDPTAELSFTTENSEQVEQQVLPTFAVVLATGQIPPVGDVQLAQLLHAQQSIRLHRPLPPEGAAVTTTEVEGIYDKGSGALVTLRSEVSDPGTRQPLATLTSDLFVRGAGGWGGDRGPTSDWAPPERPPDEVVSYATSPGQALVYRLSGDRNPLHSDPTAAAAVGFPRPILHGLCTYGFTGRALLQVVCGGNPTRFGSMAARFTAPVVPGQRLDISMWLDDGGGVFRTAVAESGVVLDHGRFGLVGD
jgi:acyl dehydratase